MPLNPRALEIDERWEGIWSNEDLPAHEYHQLPGASPSQLAQFHGVTDAEAKVNIESMDEDDPLLFMGSLCHQMVMEPNRAQPAIEFYPETFDHPKHGIQAWSLRNPICRAWKKMKREQGIFTMKRQSGKSGIGWEDILGMVSAVRGHSLMTAPMNRPQTEVEVSIVSRTTDDDPITIRTRIDLCPGFIENEPDGGFLADFKFTNKPHPESFPFHIYDMGYHIQARFSLDLWNAANPDDQRNRWLIFAVQSKPPYLAVVHELRKDFLDLAALEIPGLIRRFKRCYRTGQWNGFPQIIYPAEVPRSVARKYEG